ncbi:MAG: carboxypeptidase-like regulatory domain-containing protein [Bacteroidetes bacterium]|nr:carboxypeptidase-like regulatory domain-containing protein [Bacteroidota bacterium]
MRLLLTAIFLLFTSSTFSAILKGKITDEKGQALPFASVFVAGTTIGTSANAEGDYQLILSQGVYTIACQYIGFHQLVVQVTISRNDEIQTHHFSLVEQSLQMNEQVVKSSEDPALYIMRHVIAKRSYFLEQIRSFQTDMYLKAVMKTRTAPDKVLGQKVEKAESGLDSAGKGMLLLLEEFATFYQKGDQQKTIIHSVKQSGSPGALGAATFPSVINFYENNIQISKQISPRGFISPISNGAFNFYKFTLMGDFEENGRTIFKIRFSPKRLYEPLFQGDIYIVDNEWSIHSLDVMANKQSNMDLLDTLHIKQLYLPLEKDKPVIKQQIIGLSLKILGFDIAGNFVTVYDNQKINEPMPDSVFAKNITSEYDKNATEKDSLYWTKERPVPLLGEELNDYKQKDSLRLIFENPNYLDSMRRRSNRFKPGSLLLNGYVYRGKADRLSLQTNALLTGLINYNTVEGLNIAPRIFTTLRADSSNYFSGAFALRYGFENTHFNAIARVNFNHQYRSWIGRKWSLGAEGGKYIFQFNPHNPLDELYNTISTLFYRENYLKIYERWNANLYFGMNHGNGLSWKLTTGFQQRLPLQNSTYFSYAKESRGGFTPNIPKEFSSLNWLQHNAFLVKASISYQPGFTYIKYPNYMLPRSSKYPVFTLSYEKGIPDIFNSQIDFDKWRLDLRHELSLKLVGTLNYNIAIGGFLNDRWVGIPDLNQLNGNQVVVASPYLESFQLAPYYLYSNHAPLYGETHAEWHLNGFLTNKIPLLRQLRWYLVTGGNAYYVNDQFWHSEAFVGIDNFGFEQFRLFRLDFVHAWSSFLPETSALRIGFSPNYPVKIVTSNSGGEW